MTDENGRLLNFAASSPGAYPWRNHRNAWRPNHIHLSLFGASFVSRLVTQMYFPGDPLFEFDPIFNGVPEGARDRMVAQFDLGTDRTRIRAGLQFRYRPAWSPGPHRWRTENETRTDAVSDSRAVLLPMAWCPSSTIIPSTVSPMARWLMTPPRASVFASSGMSMTGLEIWYRMQSSKSGRPIPMAVTTIRPMTGRTIFSTRTSKGFGRMGTGTTPDNRFVFDTIKPGSVGRRAGPPSQCGRVDAWSPVASPIPGSTFPMRVKQMRQTPYCLPFPMTAVKPLSPSVMWNCRGGSTGSIFICRVTAKRCSLMFSETTIRLSVDPFVAPSHGNLFSTPDMRALWSRCAPLCGHDRGRGSPGTGAGHMRHDIPGFCGGDFGGVDRLCRGQCGAGGGKRVHRRAGACAGCSAAQSRGRRGRTPISIGGATSQDIIDTALVLVLRETIAGFETALERLVTALATMARAHADTVMLARTRMQQAAPTTFGLKVAGWRAPLVRNRERLDQLKSRLLVATTGRCRRDSGTPGGQGWRCSCRLCRGAGSWSDRDAPGTPSATGLGEFADWLTLTTDALGKIGLDVGMLAQSEMGELRETGEAGRGGSSTLPQKSNPVSSEILVTAGALQCQRCRDDAPGRPA